MKTGRRILEATGAALVFIAVTALATTVEAHDRKYSADTCHWQAKGSMAQSLHNAAGCPCERLGKGKTRRTVIQCETIKTVDVRGPVRVVEKLVKTPDVQAFDAALDRLDRAITAEASRAPRVVRVEKRIPWLRPTSEHCDGLRASFTRDARRWGGDEDEIGLQAIEDGCF